MNMKDKIIICLVMIFATVWVCIVFKSIIGIIGGVVVAGFTGYRIYKFLKSS